MDKKTPTELFFDQLESFRREQAEIEARKTPEQKATEKSQAEASRQASLYTPLGANVILG